MMRLCPFLLLSFGAVCAYGAAAESESYQLIGKILLKDIELSRNALPLVMLEGTQIPFAAHTRADLSGKFKFKDLQPDLFTLIVYIPRAGEYRRTVEVSAGLADLKKRIFVDVVFQTNLGSRTPGAVSSSQLSISEKALKEYEKARKKLGQRDSEGAIAHLRKTVAAAPQFTEAWNTLGTLAYKSGDLPLAENYFREALKHDPDYYPSVVNLGGILMVQGKIQESLHLNLAAVRARPDDALAQSQCGLNYYYLKQFDEAETYLKQAISLDPGHFSFPQLALADIYLGNKDFKSAARELEQFLALHPDAKQAPAVRKQIEEIRPRIHSTPPR
jgi:tetratricopeptide (TPR) repeat protein